MTPKRLDGEPLLSGWTDILANMDASELSSASADDILTDTAGTTRIRSSLTRPRLGNSPGRQPKGYCIVSVEYGQRPGTEIQARATSTWRAPRAQPECPNTAEIVTPFGCRLTCSKNIPMVTNGLGVADHPVVGVGDGKPRRRPSRSVQPLRP